MTAPTHEQVYLWLQTLHQQLMARQMRAARATFDAVSPILSQIDPSCDLAGVALRRLAECTDLGWMSILQLGQALARCEEIVRSSRSASAVVDARLARAFYRHLRGWHEDALTEVGKIRKLIAEVPALTEPGLLPSIHFVAGRSHAGMGQYDPAIVDLTEAVRLAELEGLRPVTGVLRIALASAYLERGQLGKVEALLTEAHRTVVTTPDDVMARATIHGIRAKLHRREGRLALALEAWDRAAREIDVAAAEHPSLAVPQYLNGKIHIGIALTSLRLVECARRAAQRDEARGRQVDAKNWMAEAATRRVRLLDSLARARRIYDAPANEHGLANVSWIAGTLALVEDDWDRAGDEARAAFTTARAGDHVARARAKQLESQAALAVAHDLFDPADRRAHRDRAVHHAREALVSALRTQHARLTARSRIYLAAALVVDGDETELAEAATLIEQATRVIPLAADDYLSALLTKTRLALRDAQAQPVGTELWMQEQIRRGARGLTTMEQVADDFKLQYLEAVMAETGQSFHEVIKLLRIGGPLRKKLKALRAARQVPPVGVPPGHSSAETE